MKKKNLLSKIISSQIQVDNNCETYSIHFSDDGTSKKLPDIREELYDEISLYNSDSYKMYKSQNNLIELSDLNSETTKDIYLVLEDGFRQRRIVLSVVHDSDWELDADIPEPTMEECCPDCGGKGKVKGHLVSHWPCTYCGGSGFRYGESHLRVKTFSPFESYVMDMELTAIHKNNSNNSNE